MPRWNAASAATSFASMSVLAAPAVDAAPGAFGLLDAVAGAAGSGAAGSGAAHTTPDHNRHALQQPRDIRTTFINSSFFAATFVEPRRQRINGPLEPPLRITNPESHAIVEPKHARTAPCIEARGGNASGAACPRAGGTERCHSPAASLPAGNTFEPPASASWATSATSARQRLEQALRGHVTKAYRDRLYSRQSMGAMSSWGVKASSRHPPDPFCSSRARSDDLRARHHS